MQEKKSIYKIYSRNRLKIFRPKNYKTRIKRKKDVKTFVAFSIVIVIALIYVIIYKAINPIFETTCIDEAQAIATRITNEETTKIMKNYDYNDMYTVQKDDDGNIQMINANVFIINQIESNLSTYIQEAIDNNKTATIKVAIGSFTGVKFLSGAGPNIKMKLASNGKINTKLRSEFIAKGINQTIHRIYLEVNCNIDILTPFETIEQGMTNNILFAENVILGNVPDTYYNFEGLDTPEDTLNAIE